MEIRRADGGDVGAIREIAERSWDREYPTFLTRETISAGIDEWYDPNGIRADLANPRSTILVAERNGKVVGFVQAHRSNGTGHVLRLYVDPDHQREGIGTALFEAVEDELASKGVERIRAMTLAENERGRAFYRALGMDRVGTGTTTIGGSGYEEAIFERPVDSGA